MELFLLILWRNSLVQSLVTTQKMKFSIKDLFTKYDQIHRKFADLVTFTEEILNRKFNFLFTVKTSENLFLTSADIESSFN